MSQICSSNPLVDSTPRQSCSTASEPEDPLLRSANRLESASCAAVCRFLDLVRGNRDPEPDWLRDELARHGLLIAIPSGEFEKRRGEFQQEADRAAHALQDWQRESKQIEQLKGQCQQILNSRIRHLNPANWIGLGPVAKAQTDLQALNGRTSYSQSDFGVLLDRHEASLAALSILDRLYLTQSQVYVGLTESGLQLWRMLHARRGGLGDLCLGDFSQCMTALDTALDDHIAACRRIQSGVRLGLLDPEDRRMYVFGLALSRALAKNPQAEAKAVELYQLFAQRGFGGIGIVGTLALLLEHCAEPLSIVTSLTEILQKLRVAASYGSLHVAASLFQTELGDSCDARCSRYLALREAGMDSMCAIEASKACPSNGAGSEILAVFAACRALLEDYGFKKGRDLDLCAVYLSKSERPLEPLVQACHRGVQLLRDLGWEARTSSYPIVAKAARASDSLGATLEAMNRLCIKLAALGQPEEFSNLALDLAGDAVRSARQEGQFGQLTGSVA